MNEKKVSIVILTYNALKYCWITLKSMKKTSYSNYEVIIVDNGSSIMTKIFIMLSFILGRIDKVCFLSKNILFAGGNNVGVALASQDSDLVLLLNSDIKIIDDDWLQKLLKIHSRGITSLGFVEAPVPRGDGYCFLIEKDLYDRFKLDEKFKWWWSITKIQAEVLKAGLSVKAVKNHSNLLVHFGGKSGTKHLKKAEIAWEAPDLNLWFGNRKIQVVEQLG